MDVSINKANKIIDWLRDYANKRINSRLIDERRCIPPYVVLDFGNQGILGMQVQAKYGGLDLTNTDAMRVVEQLAGIDLTLATFVVINNFLGVRSIARYAQESFREEMLPLLAQGRELASFALTESEAGSNPRAISATARVNPQGGWRLYGRKIWIGSGSWSGVINVFVQLLDAQDKPMGITGFCVPQGLPGLAHGGEALTMGMRGVVQNPVLFDGVAVTESNLLGEVGLGITVAQDMMLFTRLAIAAKSVGAMKRCAQLMLRYANRRDIATGRLIDNPVTQVRLSYITNAITAVETLVYRTAELLDANIAVPTEVYIACKTSGPEFLCQTADYLVQLLGGRGYIETNIAPQILRDARIFRIFEGPTEALNMFFGSCLIRPRKELERFFCEQLDGAQIWQELTDRVQEINDRWSTVSAPFNGKISARSWAFTLIGELGTYAILQAVLQEKYKKEESISLKRTINWCVIESNRIYKRAIDTVSPQFTVLTTDETNQAISSYMSSIGELRQTLPGEDDQLDEFLD
ncbi:acyl-CoA dehydrogenase family protein [Gloeocapsa sp. PCC 73106]|uniref:acyl-CoA dehydrogenase family protein n=1 Tax=Gloeocapsa sp. PCC 73106 TaxID=102232 RepID=UPI0002AC8F24|nr:acyl-CoA dehydrogenase family protein [Gloeocapsa sp. PCC 73106]ELR96361.1 acyl-CoA dehydrogenase [Gloeocapsa sp. PCC 73106]